MRATVLESPQLVKSCLRLNYNISIYRAQVTKRKARLDNGCLLATSVRTSGFGSALFRLFSEIQADASVLTVVDVAGLFLAKRSCRRD